MFYQIIYTIATIIVIIGYCKIFLFCIIALFHYKSCKKIKYTNDRGDFTPFVSVLVPAYNEEKTLENCINSLILQTYVNYEIIIINDGSTDYTRKIAENLSMKYEILQVINKSNGGKAEALNQGIKKARGEIVICVDADSIFLKNTIEKLVFPFYDKNVGAVCGNIKVANRQTGIGKNQSLEYISCLQLDRRFFSTIGCIQVVPGAIGAFRNNVLKEVGGYAKDILVEDMDLTIAISLLDYKIIYDNEAIAYTEAPISYKDLFKQRYRWSFGLLQILKKYRSILFKKRGGENGTLGLIGLPYFAISPFYQIFTFLLFVITICMSIFENHFFNLLLTITFSIIISYILNMFTLFLDKEDKRLSLRTPFMFVFYYTYLTFIWILTINSFIKKEKIKWKKLERIGLNTIPT